MNEKNLLLSQQQCKPRRGEVVIHSNRYWASELIAAEDSEVTVVYDITDVSKVDIYDLNGEFYCHAYQCDGYFPVAAIEIAREKRRAAQEARATTHKQQPLADARHFSQVHSLVGIDVSCPHCQGVVRVNIQSSTASPLASDAVDLSVTQDHSHAD